LADCAGILSLPVRNAAEGAESVWRGKARISQLLIENQLIGIIFGTLENQSIKRKNTNYHG